jgi:ABC-type branched-subunit amino acid transport system substrate-binding protein
MASNRYGLRVAATFLGLSLVIAACGSSSKSSNNTTATTGGTSGATTASTAAAVSCTGAPIKFGVITVLTGNAQINGSPDVANGAKAAAFELNKACAMGGPIQVVVCDTQDNPNTGAACGRQMVADHVVSLIGVDETGQNWFPITSAAGIPEIGGNGLDSVEVTSPMWFPVEGNIHDALAQVTVLSSTKTGGPLKWADVDLASPGIAFFDSFFKTHVEALGGTYTATISVPPTATDMSQYAQRLISSGANVWDPIISGDQENSLIQDLVQQGKSLAQVTPIQELGFSCSQVKTLGNALNGAWADDATWPVMYNTNNAGAQQYINDLTAANLPHGHCDLTESGLEAFSAVQVMTMVMKGATSVTPGVLVQKLQSFGPITLPQLPGPIDFSHNAYPNDPVLSHLRIFSTATFASQYVNGKVVVETPTGVALGQKWTPTPVG